MAENKSAGETKEQKENKAIALDKLKFKLLKLKLKLGDSEADQIVRRLNSRS